MKNSSATIQVSYDGAADAAYLTLADDIAPRGVAHTHHYEIENLKGMINLDFDAEGRLLGIEVIWAAKCLPWNSCEKSAGHAIKTLKSLRFLHRI